MLQNPLHLECEKRVWLTYGVGEMVCILDVLPILLVPLVLLLLNDWAFIEGQ